MRIRIEDLEIGMKVKLVDKVPLRLLIHSSMNKYFGKVCTVRSIDRANNAFEIQEDREEFGGVGFYWDDIFIEKIVDDKQKKNEIYTEFDEIKIRSSLKNYSELEHTFIQVIDSNFDFEKCIVNNNCVIGIFSGNERIYKGIARCYPGDKFDLAKGLTIAMLRAYKDYLDTKIKKLY